MINQEKHTKTDEREVSTVISIKNNKIRWGISAAFATLILFGTYRNVFSLAAFLGCCLLIFFFEKESILLQLFFIMPLANIFKLSPGTQSFFTILILLYVVLHLVLPRKATMLVILLAIYVVVGELFVGQFNITKTIKFICNILFLSSILNGKVDLRHKEVFLSYIIGNLVASVFGMMDSNIFKIESYVGVEEYGNPNLGNVVVRFTGLIGDPNYYAVGMIVSLCLVVLLLHTKEINPFFAFILAVPFGYFLIQTYSKSSIIMIFAPFIFLIYSFLRKKNYLAVFVFAFMLLFAVCLVATGQIPAINIIIERFLTAETAEGVDINSLTTGRFDLWIIYISYIIKNIKIMLFGGGITAGLINVHVSHNTYIDVVYYLGLAGGLLLFASLKSILSQSTHVRIKRNILNYSVLICIVIMYFFLGELFGYDPPFHIYLAFVALNMPLENDIFKSSKKENNI